MSRDFPGCLEKGVVFLLEAVQTFLQMSLPLSLRLSDLLDIAILSFVIYKILWILRKTSSGRVLWGILILLFAMALFSQMELIATSFLLGKLVEWGVVVLVVLFQPEIRRFLERVGSGRLYGHVPGQGRGADGI